MTSKEQLLSLDKPLAAWWSTIVGDSKFDRMMMILKADSFEASPTPEQMIGVSKFIASMSSIIYADEPPTQYVSSGLIHDTEPKSRSLKIPEVKQPETKKK